MASATHQLQPRVADYINALAGALDGTRRAEDRPRYVAHLAEAARWVGMIHAGVSLAELKERILRERECYGRSYLSGAEGEAAEREFIKLAAFVENLAEE